MLIGIDAGHGYNTAGKRTPDGRMREWEFNSDVATRVCQMLNNKGIETYRSDDITGKTDIGLNTRVQNINAKGVKLVISIHANAGGGTGIETYIYKNTLKGSNTLANIIQSNLVNKTGMKNRGIKEGDFAIIRDTKMDAILVECGFMDSNDSIKLLDSNYRQLCAEAIVEGVITYTGFTVKPTVNVSTPNVIQVSSYYPKPYYKGSSIVEALQAIGVNASFLNRNKIAKANGICNIYLGTPTQNNKMLELLKTGKLRK